MIVLWCTGGFRGALNWSPLCRETPVSRTAISLIGDIFPVWLSFYTEKTMFPFPFTVNGIWSWWQFSFRFSEPNGIPFGSKSKGKLSPRSYPIQCERKWKSSFLSAEPSAMSSAINRTAIVVPFRLESYSTWVQMSYAVCTEFSFVGHLWRTNRLFFVILL